MTNQASFQGTLKICEPAQVMMFMYILVFAMHLSQNINNMKLNAKTVRFLIGLFIISMTSVVTLDVYCKTGHSWFAWVLSILSLVGFVSTLSAVGYDQTSKKKN